MAASCRLRGHVLSPSAYNTAQVPEKPARTQIVLFIDRFIPSFFNGTVQLLQSQLHRFSTDLIPLPSRVSILPTGHWGKSMMDAPIDPKSPPRDAYLAILIAGLGGGMDAVQAVDLTGGRLVARIDWGTVPDELARIAVQPVILIETAGVDDAVLAAMLPRIDGYATALDLPVVVALDVAQIDIVSAGMLGANAELLCAPTMAERIAALALAAQRSTDMLHDRWREGEGARLDRLNREVARIAELLARLTRGGGEIDDDGGVADRRQSFMIESPAASATPSAGDIRRTIRLRRLRDRFFVPGLFEDPAWDMLLDLFAAELENVRVSVSSLCIAAAVAPTTALRWIARMTEAGLFERVPDPADRRRAFMRLAPRASEAMRGYFSARARVEVAAR